MKNEKPEVISVWYLNKELFREVCEGSAMKEMSMTIDDVTVRLLTAHGLAAQSPWVEQAVRVVCSAGLQFQSCTVMLTRSPDEQSKNGL